MAETKKIAVVYGTEENAFEIQVEKFNDKQSAETFADEFVTETENNVYRAFAKVVESEEEYDSATDECQALHNDILVEEFGIDVEDKDCKTWSEI